MKEHCNHLSVMFVGPMLGCHVGKVPNPSEELARRLVERGHKCLLTSSQLNRYLRLLDILFTIFRNFRKFPIMSLQVFGGPSFVIEDASSWLGKRLGMRIVMVLHGGALGEFIKRHPNWSRRVFTRAERIVTPSVFLADVIRQWGYCGTIIPNAIDINDSTNQVKHQCVPSMFWMRTFHEVYNPLMAIQVLSLLLPTYPNAILTMAGQEKGMLDELKEQVKEMGLLGCVHFIGYVDSIRKQQVFSQHDIFLNTNRIDNMPVSLLEASASGMVIISTSVGGIPFLIKHGENGLLVPNEDARRMADEVTKILENPSLAERLSRNARELAESHDWAKIIPRWESLFSDLTIGRKACAGSVES